MLDPRVIDYINRMDRFAAANNIRLTKVEPGYAEAELVITEAVLNGNNVVQGGAIFTLADIAFAGAAKTMVYITLVSANIAIFITFSTILVLVLILYCSTVDTAMPMFIDIA